MPIIITTIKILQSHYVSKNKSKRRIKLLTINKSSNKTNLIYLKCFNLVDLKLCELKPKIILAHIIFEFL